MIARFLVICAIMGPGLHEYRVSILYPQSKAIFDTMDHTGRKSIGIMGFTPNKPGPFDALVQYQVIFSDHHAVNNNFSVYAQRNIFGERRPEDVLEIVRNKTAKDVLERHRCVESYCGGEARVFPDCTQREPSTTLLNDTDSDNKYVGATGLGLDYGLSVHNFRLLGHRIFLPGKNQALNHQSQQSEAAYYIGGKFLLLVGLGALLWVWFKLCKLIAREESEKREAHNKDDDINVFH